MSGSDVEISKVGDNPVVCVFPAVYPREIIRAAGFQPMEIWDFGAGNLDTASVHLQSFACSIASSAVSFCFSEKADSCKAFLFPHTCDSLQNVSSIVTDLAGSGKKYFHLYNPRRTDSGVAGAFYKGILKKLGDFLSDISGKDWKQRLGQVTETESSIDKLMFKATRLRMSKKLDVSNNEYFRALRRIEFNPVDEYFRFLESFINNNTTSDHFTKRPAVFLTGVMPAPAGLLALLDDLGLYVSGDDFLSISRRIPVPAENEVTFDNPLDTLVDKYFRLPPCTTRGASIERRISYFLDLYSASGAEGVIIASMQMCEPELFYEPALEAALKKSGIPFTRIETGLETNIYGQTATRLEAFSEMIGGGGV